MPTIEKCIHCGHNIPLGRGQKVAVNGKVKGWVHGRVNVQYGQPCRDAVIKKFAGQKLRINGAMPTLSYVAEANELPVMKKVRT